MTVENAEAVKTIIGQERMSHYVMNVPALVMLSFEKLFSILGEVYGKQLCLDSFFTTVVVDAYPVLGRCYQPQTVRKENYQVGLPKILSSLTECVTQKDFSKLVCCFLTLIDGNKSQRDCSSNCAQHSKACCYYKCSDECLCQYSRGQHQNYCTKSLKVEEKIKLNRRIDVTYFNINHTCLQKHITNKDAGNTTQNQGFSAAEKSEDKNGNENSELSFETVMQSMFTKDEDIQLHAFEVHNSKAKSNTTDHVKVPTMEIVNTAVNDKTGLSGHNHAVFKIRLLVGKDLTVKHDNNKNIDTKDNITLTIWKHIKLKQSKPEIRTIDDPFIFMNKIKCITKAPSCLLPHEIPTYIVNVVQPVYGISWDLFERETMRVASFTNYPHSAVKPAHLLASSGFVYIGNGVNDRVKCFFCLAEKGEWQERDNVEEVHMSLNPSCPMVIVQSRNNVSSTMSSMDVGGITQLSSAMPCSLESSVTRSSVADSSAANGGFADVPVDQGNSHSEYDEVDSFSVSNNEEQQLIHSTDASVLSVPAAVTNSCAGEASIMQTASLLDPGLPRNLSSASNRTTTTTSSSGQLVNVSEGSYNNDSRSHITQSTENLNPDSIRHQVQQHSNTSDHQPNIAPPNINSQIYSIPARENDNSASESSTNSTDAPHGTQETTDSVPRNPQLTYQLLGIFHERPRYAEYAVLARRLQSFENWPEEHPIKKENLAKAGLFYAGYGDCCKCFFCGGGLRNWEDDDDPLVEHARWFGKCGFIRQFMGHDFVTAVQSLKVDGGTITLAEVAEYMRNRGQTLQYFSNERPITDDAAVKSLIDAGYNSEAVIRAAHSLRESGEVLSADAVLRKMNEDLPGASAAAASVTANNADRPDEERLKELREQNLALRNNLMCKICMDKEVRIVFLPCGHLVSCQQCSVALNDCPVCRRHIRARARANIN